MDIIKAMKWLSEEKHNEARKIHIQSPEGWSREFYVMTDWYGKLIIKDKETDELIPLHRFIGLAFFESIWWEIYEVPIYNKCPICKTDKF